MFVILRVGQLIMKEDRRILRTRRMIDEAMMSLLEEKPFSEISVTELCEKADINRNTFYSHYEKPAEVLAHLEGKIIEEISDVLSDSDVSEDVTEKVLIVLESNQRMTKILLSDYAESDFSEKIFSLARNRAHSIAEKRSSRLSAAYQDMLSCFTIAGGAAVVRRWAENGFRESSKDIAGFIRLVTYNGIDDIQDNPASEFRS
jgi:AcrR family transcriptional regulator